MGSGPRLYRGREETLQQLDLSESGTGPVVGVLESDSLPTASAISMIAEQCGVSPSQLQQGASRARV